MKTSGFFYICRTLITGACLICLATAATPSPTLPPLSDNALNRRYTATVLVRIKPASQRDRDIDAHLVALARIYAAHGFALSRRFVGESLIEELTPSASVTNRDLNALIADVLSVGWVETVAPGFMAQNVFRTSELAQPVSAAAVLTEVQKHGFHSYKDNPPAIKWRLDQKHVPNQIVIGLTEAAVWRDGATGAAQNLAPFHAAHGVKVVQVIPKDNRVVLVLEFSGSNPDLESLLWAYYALPDVDYAEPNYISASPGANPDDPIWRNGDQWGLTQIQAPSAWDIRTSAAGVTVAVIDTGVNRIHSDLTSNVLPNGWNAVDNSTDVTDNGKPGDSFTHGTHMAGILGAVTNNTLGVAGVAWSTSILPVRIYTSAAKATDVQIGQAIDYAVNNGSKVINFSSDY